MFAARAHSNKLKKTTPARNANTWNRADLGNTSCSGQGATMKEWDSESTPESRTMTLARGLLNDGSSRSPSSFSSSSASRNMTIVPSSETRRKAAQSRSLQVSSQWTKGHSDDDAQDVARMQTHPAHQSSFEGYIGYTTWAVMHPVSAIEIHWALRAARAEALLDAHVSHRRALSVIEDKRSRELEELHERYSRQFARHRRMVWTVMLTMAAMFTIPVYLLYQKSASLVPHPRWSAPMHFTIPILSPFASVIEHETSAVNVQLVAVLILAAGMFAFLWFRCSLRRN